MRYLFLVAWGYEHVVRHVIKSPKARRFDHVPTACSYPNVTQKKPQFVEINSLCVLPCSLWLMLFIVSNYHMSILSAHAQSIPQQFCMRQFRLFFLLFEFYCKRGCIRTFSCDFWKPII